MTNVPYGDDYSSYALYNGQIVVGQAYTVWSNATGTSQVTTNLWNSSGTSAVGTPYYVYSNANGQLEFQTAANIQPVWVKAVGDTTGQLIQMNPTTIPARVVALESEILNVLSIVPPIPVTTNLSPNYTQTNILASAVAGNITITLPTAVGHSGIVFMIKKVDATGNTVTVASTGGQQIDGSSSSKVLAQTDRAYQFISDGSNWWVIVDFHPGAPSTATLKGPSSAGLVGATGYASDAGHQHPFIGSGIGAEIQFITASTYNVTLTDYLLLADYTAGTSSIYLPDVGTCTGQIYVIKKIDSGGHTATIIPYTSGQVIDGQTSITVTTQLQYVAIQSDGFEWWIIAQSAGSLDSTATDIVSNGTQAAGATGKAADAGHVHPFNSVSAFNLSAIANTETLVLKLPLAASNVKAGSTYVARIVGSWTNTATTGSAVWTIRAGTTGTVGSDSNVATFTQTTNSTTSGGVPLQIDITFTLTGTGATATIIGVETSIEGQLGYAALGVTNHFSSNGVGGWNTSTATFLDLSFNSGASSSNLVVQSAYMAQVA